MISETPTLERRIFMRNQAITTLELTKGINGTISSTLKAIEDLAHHILELTSNDYLIIDKLKDNGTE